MNLEILQLLFYYKVSKLANYNTLFLMLLPIHICVLYYPSGILYIS